MPLGLMLDLQAPRELEDPRDLPEDPLVTQGPLEFRGVTVLLETPVPLEWV